MTKNFKAYEFGHLGIDSFPFDVVDNLSILAAQLQVIRDYVGLPIFVNSGYRTKKHNEKVGGEKDSQHLLGLAADIWVQDMTPEELCQIIEALIKKEKVLQGGLGLYNTFVHYDARGYRARWDYRT